MLSTGRVVLVLLLSVAALVGIVSEATPQSSSPVRIGHLAALTGVGAVLGKDVDDGFKLYLDQVNNEVAGRKIEVITEDEEFKADVALTKARKLVERDRVHVIAGPVSSASAYAVRDYITSRKLPTVLTIGAADGLTQEKASPYIFKASITDSLMSLPFGDWLYRRGYRRIVLMAPNYAAGVEIAGGIARTFTRAGGQVVQEIYPPLGAPDYAPFLTQVDRTVNAVVAFFFGADAIRFVKQYTEFGLKEKVPLLGHTITEDGLLPHQREAAEGVITVQHYTTFLETPESQKFVSAFTAKYNRPIQSIYAEAGFVAARMIVEALHAVKGNVEDAEGFRAALRRTKFTAPRGPFALDRFHAPVQNTYILRVEKAGDRWVNRVIDTIPNVNQFWTWDPDAYMKLPGYSEMQGKWARGGK